MARAFKWLGVGFGALLLLACVGAAAGYLVLRNTVQPASGIMEIAGLSGPVETTRDKHGIPHIVAQTKADAFAALGFAHAQDRLWQMEVLRMSGQGRLSEMFGESTVDIDRFLRTLGFMRQAESSFEAFDATHKAELEAYTAGVNAFLARQTGAFEPHLPPEFLILGHEPEAWQPAHSLLVLKIMSLRLSMNRGREVARLKLAAHGLSPDEINDIFPGHRDDNPPPLPDLREMYDLKKPEPDKTAALQGGLEILRQGGHWASNNWVFAGSRTQSGKPLLANDPHLGFTAPSLWYLAHLKWQDGNGERQAIGATIPAFPAILLGRTDRLAWGFTNSGADVQDLFVEQIDPQNPGRYRTPDGWQDFETREERIAVDGAEAIVEQVLSTRHGPVLPQGFSGLDDMLPENHVVALAWTGLEPKDPAFGMVSSLAEATSVDEFRKVASKNVAPMQSIVVADVAGNIGLLTPAAVPVRQPENLMMGRAPVPGWIEKYDWARIADGTTMIDIMNPPSGALGTANSRLPVETQANFYTFDWDEPFRTDRVNDHILAARSKQTAEDMIAGQLDSYSPAMSELRDRLVEVLGSETPEDLKNWDGRMETDRREPLFMTVLHRNLLAAVFADDLGDAFDTVYTASGVNLLRALDGKGARDWCDDKTTSEKETCNSVLKGVYEKTAGEMDRIGETWGDVHTVYNEHSPFSRVWPLSGLFTIERRASGGNFALRRGETDFENEEAPFRAAHGAGYRAVYDFADLDKSLFIQTTGQSGNPFSKHYDDMADLWAEGRYLQMMTKPEDYKRNALGTWRLEPAR